MNFTEHPEILNNKYSRLYKKLVSLPDYDGYVEKHHILPKSLGGTDDNENLVSLSSRKHFLCHYLLTKFTIGKSFHYMSRALSMMAAGHNGNRYFNSRLYERTRKHMSVIMSISQRGSGNSQFGKVWITHELFNSKKIYGSLLIQYLDQGWYQGRTLKCVKPKKIPSDNKYRNFKLNQTGSNNWNHNSTVYEFVNKNTGQTFTGTQNQLRKTFPELNNVGHISSVTREKKPSYKGWMLLKNLTNILRNSLTINEVCDIIHT